MTTLLLSHSATLDHLTPRGHPERPDRIRAVLQSLGEDAFADLKREDAPLGDTKLGLSCHPASLIAALEAAVPQMGETVIDADTIMSPGTWDAVRRALGAAIRGVDAVMGGEAANTFCAVRPPGHHAERNKAMGFCFLNTVAIAARYAQEKHGLERVAIVDWDVHHGNGTQDIVWDDPSVLFASTHEMPLYPGSGAPNETGAHGNVVNGALRAGDDGAAFRALFSQSVLPRLRNFKPQMILISAGFDAHWRDPLANINLKEADFAWATREVMEIAAATASGRIVSLLEGGYDLQGLASSASAHVQELMKG
jgi:acetoin utilization deacetylase AcuC-like enzyme